MAENDSCPPGGPKHKNCTPRRYSNNGPMPKKVKNTKRKRGKRNWKRKNGKYFNRNKEGHFARDYTEPIKVLLDFNSHKIFISAHVVVAHSHPYWITDSRMTEHVARGRVRFIEYYRIPKGS